MARELIPRKELLQDAGSYSVVKAMNGLSGSIMLLIMICLVIKSEILPDLICYLLHSHLESSAEFLAEAPSILSDLTISKRAAQNRGIRQTRKHLSCAGGRKSHCLG